MTGTQIFLGIVGFVGFSGIVTVVKVIIDYANVRMTQMQYRKELDDIKADIKEFRLYRLAMTETIAELTTSIKMMSNNIDKQFEKLEKKIDEMRKGRQCK
nr:MAG TPA: hypothetical protein [Caudoviricetes sp.]